MPFKTTANNLSCPQSVAGPKELLAVLTNKNKAMKLSHNQQGSKIPQHRQQQEQLEESEWEENEKQHFQQRLKLHQIELIYRAEGNANLVLALPQFRKVLRLPKFEKENLQQQKHLQGQLKQQYETNKLEPCKNSIAVQQEANNEAPDIVAMEHYVSYISIIRCLAGNEFVYEADIVAVKNPTDRLWINEHIKHYRPVNRLNKEFGGHFGLLLPDATQLPAEFDILFPDLKTSTGPKTTHDSSNSSIFGSDTFAVEIKPKQGWLLPNNVNNLFDSFCNSSTIGTCITQRDDRTTHLYDKVDTRCRYCCMQFLKMKQQKVVKRSQYCPIDLFSGSYEKMVFALQALFECPQNNLRFFRNGKLLFDDETSRTTKIEDVFSSDKLQLLKQLLVTCLLKEYNKKDEVINKEKEQMSKVTQQEFLARSELIPDEDKSKTGHRIQTKSNVIETTSTTLTKTEVTTVKLISTLRDLTQCQEQFNKIKMNCLPTNCVLQKILNLQLLAMINLQYMIDHKYADKKDKTYYIVFNLLEKFAGSQNQLTISELSPAEQYTLAATALDCSIMITFCEIENIRKDEKQNPKESSIYNPYVVTLCGKTYLTKVTLLDLDPKPDTHFNKYYRQTIEIVDALKEL